MHINSKDNSSIEHQGESEPLYHHCSHLFVDAIIAMAFDIDHRVHHHWVQYIQQHGFYGEQHILLNSDEPQHLAGEAQPAQSLRSPVLPSQQEQDTHSLTHQPYRSWCRVCQQAKGRGGQHRRQHQQEENVSIIQLDYTRSCTIHIKHLNDKADNIPTRYSRPSSLQQDLDWRCLRQRKAIRHIKQHNYIVGSSSTDSQKVYYNQTTKLL